MDLDSALQHDPRDPTDLISPNNEDLGLIIEQIPASTSIVEIRCVNCNTDLSSRRRRLIRQSVVATIVRQWIAPQLISDNSVVCEPCWMVALRESRDMQTTASDGHQRQLCIHCRCSLYRIRFHILNGDTQRGRDINRIVTNWIRPTQLIGRDSICHGCWALANQAASRVNSAEPQVEEVLARETFTELPNLTRAGDSQSVCFVHNCQNIERYIVPIWLRLKLFKEHFFYVPPTCRVCPEHMQCIEWDFLQDGNYSHRFTIRHIEDFASFTRVEFNEDWNDLDTVGDDLFFNWVGLYKNQFNELRVALPLLNTKKYANIALVAFLCRLRTGDSFERISSTLKVKVTTCKRYVVFARNALLADFLPRNLGISHLTREEIRLKNLLIPRELFTDNNDVPIVIIDGTYVYVRKSSNYLYQKNTYSLHKYRNLFKPLLIVCCDGYILDILGPYPATTSDANIILKEFSNSEQPLRQYFQQGDVFILDRGFRDCISLLQECNYSPQMPASLRRGETQLSTTAANQSRKVTLCRWVVECVNGIIKQCFKLFRHDFFNKGLKSAMDDFKIAGALVNKFHQRYRDRDDAGNILERIRLQERLSNNKLGDYIVENNLNRRRADFIALSGSDVSFSRLTMSQLILIACGTYQLKQARSYYAESVRLNGTFTVEICDGNNLLIGFPSAADNRLIRGKIRSRHISRKIYFCYILYSNDEVADYYCNCMVGRRTVGCCAHVCTIIWYLGWARHEPVINHPASHLDNTLIVFEED